MFDPEAFFPVLERVAEVLNRCGIRFHLTGGLVSVFYAEPRLTQDADLVVDPVQLKANLEQFISEIQQLGYLANAQTIRDAAQRGRMFQVIDTLESLKIDFYPRELVPGSLDRSVVIDMTSRLRLPIASLPDVIASKLVWISKGSHKSRRDVRQLMQRASPDEAAMAREFVVGLGLSQLLEQVLAESDEIDA